MKITQLLEASATPSSTPSNEAGSQAPVFGRSNKFLEDEKTDVKVEESDCGTSTSAGIASVSAPIGGVQRRGKGSMLQGIKTSAKFPNSKQVKEADEWEEDTDKRERFLQYAKQKLLAAVRKGNLSEIALALSVQDNKYFGTPFIDYDIHNRKQGFGSVTVGYVEPKYTAAIANIVDWIKSSQGQAQVAAQQAAIWLEPHGKEFLGRVHSDLLSMQDNTREARQKHAIALSGYQVEHLGGKVRGSFKGDSPSDPRDMMTQEVYDIFEIAELEIARIHNKRLYDEDLAERKKLWDSIPGPIKATLAAEHNMNPQQMEAMLFGETEADKVAGYYNNQEQPEREVAEGNKFLQQHGFGGGKFPEPRKPSFPGDHGSKSETVGKDGLIYHFQDPRAYQGEVQGASRGGAVVRLPKQELNLPSGITDKSYLAKVSQACIGGRGTGINWEPDPKDIPYINAERQKRGLPAWKGNIHISMKNNGMAEAKKANTKTARAEFGKRVKAKPSEKEQEQKKSESDEAWERLMAYAAAQKKEKIDEVNPHNYDSDEDYYAALNAPVRQRSSISYRPRDTDSYGNSWSEEEAFRANQRRYAAAKKKAEQEADHDRLATGTNESEMEEGQRWPDSSNSLAKRKPVVAFNNQGVKAGRPGGMTVATRVDPTITSTKVQRKDDRPIPSFLQKEAANPAQQAAIAIAKKKEHGVAEGDNPYEPEAHDEFASDTYYDDTNVSEEFNAEYDDEASMFKNDLQTIQRVSTHLEKAIQDNENLPEWCQSKIAQAKGMVVNVMDYMISQHENGEVSTVDEDWQKTNKQDKTDGMSSKAVKAYRRENPGSKLKTAVTTKPSKLKAGSKAAKRRKSFCARMGGMKGPMKDEKGRPTAKAKALRRWNCESIEEMQQLIQNAEQAIKEEKQRLDPKCWKGYKKQGTKVKGGVRVNNCVPVSEAEVSEDKLANDLYKDFQIFKKGDDKGIGSKAKDKDISSKAKDKEIIAKVTKKN